MPGAMLSVNAARVLGKLAQPSRVMDAGRRTVERATAAAVARAEAQAPGSLRSRVRKKIERDRRGYFGRIWIDPVSRRGFRFAHALDNSVKVRYHHRSGPLKGKLTRKWFTSAKTGLKARMRRDLRAEKDALRRWWG